LAIMNASEKPNPGKEGTITSNTKSYFSLETVNNIILPLTV